MKTKTILVLSMMSLLLNPMISYGAETDVSFTDPTKFRDIEAGNGHQGKFRTKVLNELEEHFTELAKKLPKEQKLIIEVTDLDLAGSVNHGGMNQFRLIKEVYIPTISFSYQLVDANEEAISADIVKIKDMNFMNGIHRHSINQDSLLYEKKMIEEWFNKTFTALINQAS